VVPLPPFLRRWLRLRRQLLLLQLPRFYSGGGAEITWLPSFFIHPPFSRPWGEATRLPLQPVWHRVVREGCQGSPPSV